MKCSVSDVKCSIPHAELVEVAHAACVPFSVLFFLMHRSIPVLPMAISLGVICTLFS